jgi:hypothetical protein
MTIERMRKIRWSDIQNDVNIRSRRFVLQRCQVVIFAFKKIRLIPTKIHQSPVLLFLLCRAALRRQIPSGPLGGEPAQREAFKFQRSFLISNCPIGKFKLN